MFVSMEPKNTLHYCTLHLLDDWGLKRPVFAQYPKHIWVAIAYLKIEGE